MGDRDTTSLQWALTQADKQGWFEICTNRWIMGGSRRVSQKSPGGLGQTLFLFHWKSAAWHASTLETLFTGPGTNHLSSHKPPPLWQLIKCSFCILLFHWFTLTWLYIGGGDGYLLSFWSFTFTYIFWLVSLFTAVQKEDRVTILICTALLWNGQSHRIIEYLKVDETHKIIMLHVGVT